MPADRLEDVSLLLSVLALPFGCGAVDRTSSSSTSGADESTSTSAMSSSAMSATEDGQEGPSSNESTTTRADTTDGSTTGVVVPFCVEYGTHLAECFPDTMRVEEAIQGCYLYTDDFPNDPACYEASRVFLMCELAADCEALQGGDPCLGEQSEVEHWCSTPSEE